MKYLISIWILFSIHFYSFEKENITDSFLDERDNTSYKTIQVNSLIWFNENLSYQTENSRSIKTESLQKLGRLYSYADSKMACPKGWRLPTVKEFDELINEAFKINFYGSETVDFNWSTIAENHAGFHFNKTGFLHKKKIESTESFNIWLEGRDVQDAYHVHMYNIDRKDEKGDLTIFRHTHTKHKPKKNRRFAIRCVCEASLK